MPTLQLEKMVTFPVYGHAARTGPGGEPNLDFWLRFGALLQRTKSDLPGLDTPQGVEVLLWLLHQKKPQPLKELYRASDFSEPTLRKALTAFVDGGFATIKPDKKDARLRRMRVLPKLKATVREYQEHFCRCALVALRTGMLESFMYFSESDGRLSQALLPDPEHRIPQGNAMPTQDSPALCD